MLELEEGEQLFEVEFHGKAKVRAKIEDQALIRFMDFILDEARDNFMEVTELEPEWPLPEDEVSES